LPNFESDDGAQAYIHRDGWALDGGMEARRSNLIAFRIDVGSHSAAPPNGAGQLQDRRTVNPNQARANAIRGEPAQGNPAAGGLYIDAEANYHR
jgi:hypothetical protein